LITRLDPLALRRRLPSRLVEWAFARLSVLVRLAARRSGTTEEVRDEHYPVGDAGDECLDLLAVCRRPRAAARGS
jgi:hypothetical protein